MAAYDALYESNGSAAASIRAATRQIEDLLRFDEQFRDAVPELESARIAIEDIGARLRDYGEGIEASPERLAEVEDRLAALDRLKRKYGPTLKTRSPWGRSWSASSTRWRTRTKCCASCASSWRRRRSSISKPPRALSRQRYEAARKLEKLVESEINELAMKARFKVEVSGTDEESNWTSRGFDQVQYLISANPGEPLGPVDEIASGGELSRVMLALKTSIETGSSIRSAESGRIRCLTYWQAWQEWAAADAGLRRNRRRHRRTRGRSGRQEVEAALADQAGTVHHAPAADRVVRRPALPDREERGGRQNEDLSAASRRRRAHEEIARMMSGAKLTETSLKHAEQMIEGESVKQGLEIRGLRLGVRPTLSSQSFCARARPQSCRMTLQMIGL